MNRRDFLRTAGGAAGASTAAGAAASPAVAGDATALQNETEGQNESGGNETGGQNESEGGSEGGDLPGSGETAEVIVGPEGNNTSFDPAELEILPGTTVNFVWQSDNHNIVPDGQPDDAQWQGIEETHNAGFEYSHTFTVEGEYHYFCRPHQAAGMEGDIIVTQDASSGEEGHEEVEPAHMGVPIQKHFIGIGTFLAIFVTFVFTFYVLKYGESAHTSAPGKE